MTITVLRVDVSITVAIETPDQPEIRQLVAQLDAYQAALYPPESNHFVDIITLTQPGVIFAVARDDLGNAVGCGAIVLAAEYGELKRMFVHPAHRNRRTASQLLRFLEDAAMSRGCRHFRLETGIRQPAALAFYTHHGYLRCSPFGRYESDPLSVFMEKRTTRAER